MKSKLAILIMLVSFSLQAETELMFKTGWRRDNIGSTVEIAFDPGHDRQGSVASLYVHDLNLWEVEAKGVWESDCSHWLIEGSASYGWAYKGVMEHQHNTSKQSIDGNSLDYSVAIGRVFDVCGCFDVVPLVGYSYSKLYMTANNMLRYYNQFITDVLDYPILFQDIEAPFSHRDRVYSYTPYVGFDVRYFHQFCGRYDFNFVFGYEFHYGNGYAGRKISDSTFSITALAPVQGYGGAEGFHVNIKRLIINVFRFEANYSYCNCWELGVELKYSNEMSLGKNNLKLTNFQAFVDAGYYPPDALFPFFLNEYEIIQARLQLGYKF